MSTPAEIDTFGEFVARGGVKRLRRTFRPACVAAADLVNMLGEVALQDAFRDVLSQLEDEAPIRVDRLLEQAPRRDDEGALEPESNETLFLALAVDLLATVADSSPLPARWTDAATTYRASGALEIVLGMVAEDDARGVFELLFGFARGNHTDNDVLALLRSRFRNAYEVAGARL
ncbi:MAG: hypothetical protein AAGE52_40520 [Myxococcota bacterium]